jgi:hypothetical protein
MNDVRTSFSPTETMALVTKILIYPELDHTAVCFLPLVSPYLLDNILCLHPLACSLSLHTTVYSQLQNDLGSSGQTLLRLSAKQYAKRLGLDDKLKRHYTPGTPEYKARLRMLALDS